MLSIGLALENIEHLEERLVAVSTPGNPEYGRYLDRGEMEDFFYPSPEAYGTVIAWLQNAGVEYVSQQGASINFATTISNANKLLDTRFAYYNVDGVQKLRTKQYSVPGEVTQYIHLIHPTTYFGKTRSHKMPEDMIMQSKIAAAPFETNINAATHCSALVTPDCFRNAYGVGHYKPDPDSGSRVAFGSFLNQSARLDDLHLYQSTYGIPLSNFSVVTINGGLDHQDPNGHIGEANLDAQFENAMSYPLPQIQYITGGKPPFIPNLDKPTADHNSNEPYLEYYEYLLNRTNDELPQVISNSYGDDEQTVPPEYAKRVCDMIGLMGLRGITVLYSSGDTGTGASCLSNDGKNHTEFTPAFPSTCPYTTSVGGTQSWGPEIGWRASTGGFSNYFPRAWYQENAVEDYLKHGINSKAKAYYEAGGFTNFSGRAFPDISAHSLHPNYAFFSRNRQGSTGGTSASVPIVAGLIGLLNDVRLRAGKPTMGFINPFLYGIMTKGGSLIDVATGTATGCDGTNSQTGEVLKGSGIIPYASWNNTVGWDPVTGLGMPNFADMAKAALLVAD
ncbi:tripeptidyl peptidase A [Truncatella angustata]|uniref:tripeptidyl-peptidase II n=1 Tax=Truncatella angustata TaxID=152316 RepID=A0A9P8UYQ5_9PEZI|nr:tripeptidyl peptidase A [Truncatella angustata]KAH6660808.1 tripeptidyl peptidase A [Truncatella angustata]